MQDGIFFFYTFRTRRTLGRDGQLQFCQLLLARGPRFCGAIEAILHLGGVVHHHHQYY